MVPGEGHAAQRGLDRAVEPGRGVPEPVSPHQAPWCSQAWPPLLWVGSRLGWQWELASVVGSPHGLLGHEGALEAVLALAGSPLLPVGPVSEEPLARNRSVLCGFSCSVLDLHVSL